MKHAFLIVLAMLSNFVFPTAGRGDLTQFPSGFHNGGTAACDFCHARAAANTTQTGSATYRNSSSVSAPSRTMLTGGDPSSTCLICHSAPVGLKQPSSFYVATSRLDLGSGTPPTQLGPAGDFGWLLKNYTWSSKDNGNNNSSSMGERHGHNVVAVQFGFEYDSVNSISPGGNYPAQSLSCTSCHDPHGTYRRAADGSISTIGLPIKASGSSAASPDPDASGTVGTYRMLAGKGYQPKSLVGDFSFTADPPHAVSPVIHNRSETANDIRVAYGSGMSEWCANCHVNSHKKGGGHPNGQFGKFSQSVLNTYNKYILSGNLTGSKKQAYSSLVPYEMGTSDYSVLKANAVSDGSNKAGPETGSNVMCLSCHRAHASGWDNIARWNMKSSLLTYNSQYAGTDNLAPPDIAQGRTAAEVSRAYYDRPAKAFGPYQKGLCSKCHEKD